MDPWETIAARFVDTLGQSALNFGAAYGNAWLGNQQIEAAYELAARYQPRPVVVASNPLLTLLVLGGIAYLALK